GPTKQGISLTLAAPRGTPATVGSDRAAHVRTCCHTRIRPCWIAARRKPRSPLFPTRRVWGHPLRHGRAEGADSEKQPIATCCPAGQCRAALVRFGQGRKGRVR